MSRIDSSSSRTSARQPLTEHDIIDVDSLSDEAEALARCISYAPTKTCSPTRSLLEARSSLSNLQSALDKLKTPLQTGPDTGSSLSTSCRKTTHIHGIDEVAYTGGVSSENKNVSAARDPGPGGVPNRKSSRERVPIRPAMSMEKTIFIGDTGRTLHAVKHDMHAGQATTARRELMQYLSQKTSIVQNVGQELAISDTHASGAAGQWLQGCTISVDVRSDDGVVAGSLYEEMLALMGAKVITRVGRSCTHVVYKSGTLSTLNRYRSLRDPKPLVVGLQWIVECAKRKRRVGETPFLVDLSDEDVVGTRTRRRHSFIPQAWEVAVTMATDNGKPSVSTSKEYISFATDEPINNRTECLPPLERARLRKHA